MADDKETKSYALAAVGFVFGCFLIVSLFFLANFLEIPRVRIPIILPLIPFIFAWFCYKEGTHIIGEIRFIVPENTPLIRLAIVSPFFWLALVGSYVVTFKPFGSRLFIDDWLFLVKVIGFPPLIFWSGFVVLKYFVFKKS